MTQRCAPDPALEGFFHEPYRLQKSAQAIARFPFPFSLAASTEKATAKTAPYRYSVNIEPHVPDGVLGSVTEHYFDVDEFYFAELHERRRALAKCPQHMQVLPEVSAAAWELLSRVLTQMARDYPEHFTCQDNTDGALHWHNQLTGQKKVFALGANINARDCANVSPMQFLASQLPGDWVLLQQKDTQLWLKGGAVTGPASWSLNEKLGMNYLQWHSPVPDQYQVFQRSLKYLLRLPPGQPLRRKNWGLCVHPRLEMSMENRHEWQYALQNITDTELPQLLNLRVELQVLERLPNSQAIAFYIRTYFLTMAELKQNRHWAQRFIQVLESLPEDIVEYKNLTKVIAKAICYLK